MATKDRSGETRRSILELWRNGSGKRAAVCLLFDSQLISQDSTLAPGKHISALRNKHILIMFTWIQPQEGNPFGNIVCSNSVRISAVFYLRSNGLI